MDTVEFFSLVCPDEGYRYIAVLKPHPSQKRNYFKHVVAATSHREAAVAVHDWEDTPFNVYFSCVSFREAEYVDPKDGKTKRRTLDNAYLVKSFWRDLDVGLNDKGNPKPNAYESQEAAMAAVKDFCSTTGFPLPLCVSSGSGIHIYWPLTRSIRAESWVVLAKLLTKVLLAYGVKTDPSRDHDLTSVLRPVGSTNKKHGKSAPVSVLWEHERLLTPREMANFLASLAPEDAAPETTVPAYLQGTSSTTLAIAAQAPEYPPADANLIANQCAQLAHFRETGSLTYSNWWLGLGVLKHCIDGEKVAHEWSSRSDDYDYASVQFKLDDWSAGPATCESFSGCGDLCNGCAFKGKIKSPIRLGVSEVVSEEQTQIPLVPEDDDDDEKVAASITLPSGYVFHNETVCAVIKDENGLVEYVPISNIAFWAEMRYRVPDGSMVIQYRCRLRKNGDNWRIHKFEVPAEVVGVGGATLFGEFARYEVYPAKSKGARKLMENYVLSMADDLRRRKEEIQTYRTFGWQADGSFLLGSTLYTAEGNRSVIVGGDAAPNFVPGLEPRGDHTVWAETVGKMYSLPGHQEYQMAVMLAIGAPLLEFFKIPTGCPVNLLGDKGLGKTTAAEVGLSAYGAPDTLGTKWDSTTEQALYSRLSTLKNLPVLVDEMTNADPQVLSRLIYSIANGKPRDRLQSSGKRNDAVPSWALVTLMSSNSALADRLAGFKADASAELTRLVEVPWRRVETISRQEMDTLLVTTRANQGSMGVAFVKFCVANREKVEKILFRVREKIEDAAGLTKEFRFWSAHMAVPIASLFICQKHLGVLTEFDLDELFEFVLHTVKRHKADLSEWAITPTDAVHCMVTDLSRGIIMTAAERDGRVGSQVDSVNLGGADPIGRVIRSSGDLYLTVKAVRDWCSAKRIQYTMLKQAMQDDMILIGMTRYYIGRGTNIPTGQEYCMHLDWDKLQRFDKSSRPDVEHLQLVK